MDDKKTIALANHQAKSENELVNWLKVGLSGGDGADRCGPVLQRDMLIDRYRLVEEHGKGGFGVVWKAVQVDLFDKPVALKFIRPEFAEKMLGRFEAERQVLARMTHPCIVSARGVGGTVKSGPYLVMDWIDGSSICQFCDGQGLDVAARLRMFVLVCLAVQHAHQKGILHRDLKPSNILVECNDDGEAVPKVIDFGIAKVLEWENSCTELGALIQSGNSSQMGTPQYMSPEQVTSGADMEVTSDVYALGIVLYELLTSETPLALGRRHGESFETIAKRIKEEIPMLPSQRLLKLAHVVGMDEIARCRSATVKGLAREISGDLDAIILKALSKDPSKRYQGAAELAEDIQRYLAGRSVRARPRSTPRLVLDWAMRNPAFVLLAAALILALGVAGVGAVRSGQAERQRLRAELSLRDEVNKRQGVATFLGGVFGEISGNRSEILDPNTARKLLAAADSRRRRELGSSPEMDANVAAFLASGYVSLGELERAQSMFLEAVEHTSETGGADDVGGALAHVQALWCGYLAASWKKAGIDAEIGDVGPVLEKIVAVLDGAAQSGPGAGERGLISSAGINIPDARWLAQALKATCLAREKGPEAARAAIAEVRDREWTLGLSKSPVSGWFMRQEAVLLAMLSRFDDALNMLEKGRGLMGSKGFGGALILRYPAASEVSRLKGEIYMLKGDYASAVEEFRREIEARREGAGHDAPEALLRLSSALLELGAKEEVGEVLQRAAKLSREWGPPLAEEVARRRLIELWRGDDRISWDKYIMAKVDLADLVVGAADLEWGKGAKPDKKRLQEALDILGKLPVHGGGAELGIGVKRKFYHLVAAINVRLARFGEAADSEAQASSLDRSTGLVHRVHALAYSLLDGDEKAYLEGRRLLVSEMDLCANAGEYAQAVAVALLLPGLDQGEMKLLDEAGKRWESLGPMSDDLSLAKGLREYRAGNPELASDWLNVAAASMATGSRLQAKLIGILAAAGVRGGNSMYESAIKFREESGGDLKSLLRIEIADCSFLEAACVQIWVGEIERLTKLRLGAGQSLGEVDIESENAH